MPSETATSAIVYGLCSTLFPSVVMAVDCRVCLLLVSSIIAPIPTLPLLTKELVAMRMLVL
jgi:hypothetical protein